MTNHQRRLPAEWEPQDAILMAWPRSEAGWGKSLEAALESFSTLVATILHYQSVILCIPLGASKLDIESRIVSKRIPLHPLVLVEIDCNDSWARDFGPIGISLGETPQLLDFQFNGWGNKYPADKDNAINHLLAGRHINERLQSSDVILEGGSIDSNGSGALLTTSRCLLHPQRNPTMQREDYQRAFEKLMGITTVYWIEHGYLAGDDTDGHIDMLARFVSCDTIMYTACEDKDDEHYISLRAMENELRQLRQVNGKSYQLIPLPFPNACYADNGDRLPASYANFLIINDAVLCPVYDVPQDEKALSLLAKAFPERRIEAIPARPFIHQGGSVHCLTMQLFNGSVLGNTHASPNS